MFKNGKNHRKFVRRVNKSILAMSVALVLTSVLAFYAVWRIGEWSRVAIANHAKDSLLVQELRIELAQAVAVDRAYLITGDPLLLDQVYESHSAFLALAQQLKVQLGTAESLRLLNAAIAGKRKHNTLIERAINQKLAEGDRDDLAEFFESRIQPATRELQAVLSTLLERKTALLDKATETAMDGARVAREVLLTVAVANILFSVIISRTARSTLQALDRYGSELLQAIRARDEFLAIASHELRTPLAVVKLQTQMLKRRLGMGGTTATDTGYLENFAAHVDRAVNSLSTLITRMLDTANIRKGQLRLHRETLDLNELTQETVTQLESAFSEAGSAVHFQRGPPAVGYWDKARLEQVITNLLINVTRHAPGKPAQVRVTVNDDTARLVVEDLGPGIAKEDQARIFERFERGYASTDGGGLGLGLAVSKEIIQAHGGNLWVESEAGKGAAFTVELPLNDER